MDKVTERIKIFSYKSKYRGANVRHGDFSY